MTVVNGKRFYLTMIGCVIAVLTVVAQPRYRIIDFAKLNNSVTQVNRIVRDGQGMMWFGTNDGLYRYDGYEFSSFKSRNGDGVNMPSNNVNTMYPSSEGGIWCVISNRVFLFDTQCYRYVDVLGNYEKQLGRKISVKKMRALSCGITWLFAEDGDIYALEDARPTESIRLMAEREYEGDVDVVCDQRQRAWVLTRRHTFLYHDKQLKCFDQTFRNVEAFGKTIWLLADDGKLSYYDEAQGKIRPWKHELSTAAIDGVSTLSDGRVALLTETGLLLMSPDGKKVEKTALTWPVRKVMEDGVGHLWILAKDGRLTMADDACTKVVEVKGFRADKCNIMRDAHGSVWAFSEKDEVFYSLAQEPEHLVRYEGDKMEGDISNTINDGQGGYWFIHNHRAYRLTFESPHYQHLPLYQQGQVRCVIQDGLGRLLVGSRWDETVTLFDRLGQRLGWLTSDGRISPSYVPFGASIYSGCVTSDGTLWLGSKAHGVFRLRPRPAGDYQVTNYVKDDRNPQSSLTDNEIYCFAEDRHHRLWIGTHKGGLCCVTDLKADNPHFVHVGKEQPEAGAMQESSARAMLLTKDNLLLVGTYKGLFVANIGSKDLTTISFKHHQREADREASLSSSSVTDIVCTSQGQIFLSTNDGGLNEVLTKDLTADQLDFRHYNLSTGFPADITHFIAEYKGALWTTAPNKLVELQLMNTDLPNVNSYLMRENPKFSSCKPVQLDKGRWVFGSEDGALLINLDELKSSTFVPPLVVTGVSIENSPVDYAAARNDTIVLSSKERDMTVWFSALDYENTELVAYAYRMDDDGEWKYLGQNHSVTFSQMRPGKYRMTIRSTNSNGAWCDNERALTIIVTPTFWETPWGILLIVLIVAVVVGIVLFTLLYIRRIKRQQRDTMEAYLALLSLRDSSAAIPENSQPDHDEAPVEIQRETPLSDQSPASTPNNSVSPEDDEIMKRMLAFIEKHLGDSDVTIDDIASAAAVSRSGLHRKVKHLLGTSPMEFLREARIRKAKQMLAESSESITEVAYQCGFSDPKYFSKCFKASTGQTPTEYKGTL